jgi:hypothetical protein
MEKLLRKIKCPASFVNFSVAITRNANGSVILNGQRTESFEITCSMRQGCPITPLFFVLVVDALSRQFTRAQERKEIRGVYFEREDITLCHQFYADNTTIMLEADSENARECLRILSSLGRLQG